MTNRREFLKLTAVAAATGAVASVAPKSAAQMSEGPAKTTGLVWHELYMWHNTGIINGAGEFGLPVQPIDHIEGPEPKRRIRNLVDAVGLDKHLECIEPRLATDEEVLRFHTHDYLDRLKAHRHDQSFVPGPAVQMGRGSLDIALLSAGGCIEAAESIMQKKVTNAYALVRPPGHHAVSHQGMGFCVLGNAVLAGKHLLEVHQLNRIAYLDWDVHHGNGTQDAFYNDDRALTISLHQDRCYPATTGMVEERGEGRGFGYNINVPLPPGSGTGTYKDAFERIVIPALRRYRPEFIIIPSGFDAGGRDALGRMMLHSGAYRHMTQRLMEAAAELCDGRLLMTHEGGYDSATAPFYGLAVLEELSGVNTGVTDPYEQMISGMGQQEIQPHQRALIDLCTQLLSEL